MAFINEAEKLPTENDRACSSRFTSAMHPEALGNLAHVGPAENRRMACGRMLAAPILQSSPPRQTKLLVVAEK